MDKKIIKKKKGINTTTLVAIIVCAVVVLACVAFVGYKLKWFYVPAKAQFTVDAHDTLEIDKADVEVSDSTLESAVTSMQSHYATTEEVTEGTVEEGDKIHIVYTGRIDGEEFDGGSTGEDGTDITVGSANYIDGFEDGLVGEQVGSTVTLDLTFPEDYGNEELNGKDVTFEVEIQYKEVTNTPEATDEFIKENSEDYISSAYSTEGVQLETVEEYKEWVKDYTYNSNMRTAVNSAICGLIHSTVYDETAYEAELEYQAQYLSYYASIFSSDADYIAQMYGYDDAEAYEEAAAKSVLDQAEIYSYLADELGIERGDVDEAIQEYMEANGYDEDYTVESFKEANGTAWLYQFEKCQMVYDEVLEAMTERVVLVETAEEETEAEAETTAE